MSSLNIQQNIPLAKFTTFKIGGPAKFFCEVGNEKELIKALNYAKENNLEIFVLGGGSNILISDEGFNGLVIRIQNTKHQIQDTKIECGAGINLSEIVKLSAENSLTGLEWAAGIPGTVGGAICGNAGAYGSSIAESVEEIRVLESSKIKNYKSKECKFKYRDSIFKENRNLIIVSIVLKFKKGKKNEIENKIKEIIKKRTEKIPKEQNAGSFFKNPKVENRELIASFERDTGQKAIDGKIPAGWLIDEVGLRGKKIGGAEVSEKHANFVVNLGGAKAQDIVMLASLIKMKVRDELGVQLSEEIQYVGF
jgi:UDP-N-acetylmuramate dehydrogenase